MISSPATKLAATFKEAADARAAYFKVAEKLPDVLQDDPELDRLGKEMADKEQKAISVAMEIAQADPQSDVAFDALSWVVMHDTTSATSASAIQLLIKYHVASPKIGRPLAYLAYYIQYPGLHTYAPLTDLMNAVLQKNPDRTARGQAALGLAHRIKWAYDVAEIKSSSDRERLALDAEKAFQSVINEYGDCRDLREGGGLAAQSTLAEELKSDLYELQHLRSGQTAPDIEGEDLDGIRFKLSDYRGKAVLLVFWATWCGPCMTAVPHEREIVQRFHDRPFVLIGVNGDEKKDTAQKAAVRLPIPWRSFWNGGDGSDGPLSRAWNVRGWPTVYLIDAEGLIRRKYVGDKDLDGALEDVVSKAEIKKPN